MVSRHEAGPLRIAEQAIALSLEMKFLDETSLPDLLRLQEVIAANLPCPEVFMLHDENAVAVARMAEDIGVVALAVHGRTRADMFDGEGEYDTIAEVASRVTIPVFANGDIDGPEKAAAVLARTGAAGVMIGRAAQGRPWIFRQVNSYLATGVAAAPPSPREVRGIMISHLESLHAFYGEEPGVRIARKHLGWYCRQLTGTARLPAELLGASRAVDQLGLATVFLDGVADGASLAA